MTHPWNVTYPAPTIIPASARQTGYVQEYSSEAGTTSLTNSHAITVQNPNATTNIAAMRMVTYRFTPSP